MNPLAMAWRELRLHPGRFAASLAAIVLSVAFVAATQTFAATESTANAKRAVLATSRADVIVDSHLWRGDDDHLRRDKGLKTARTALLTNPEVVAVAPFSQAYAQLAFGQTFAGVTMMTAVSNEHLRWFGAVEGSVPMATGEVMVTAGLAERLGIRIGDSVHLAVGNVGALTVVGITGERGFTDPPVYVVQEVFDRAVFAGPDPRVIVNPLTVKRTLPGSSGDGPGVRLLVKVADPARADAVVAATQQRLTDEGVLKIYVQPKLASEVRAQGLAEASAGVDWTLTLVSASAGVAVLVGMLIIANTFAILVGQRRRQIGLLRAVGATRGQVLRRYLAEAFLLGLLGSVLGVPLGVGLAALFSTHLTHSAGLGVEVPWGVLGLALAGGVVVTVAAALAPVRGAMRVSPLEALQPAAPAGLARRRAVVRAVVCAVLVAAGAAVLWLALDSGRPAPPGGPAVAAGAGVLAMALGLLGGAALYVPALLRGFGRVLGGALPTTGRLAVANAARNPARVGATASALMIAVGLIVTLQVGSASIRSSAFALLDQRYPVDLTLQSAVATGDLVDPNGAGPADQRDADGRLIGFTPDTLAKVRATPGVADAVLLKMTQPVLVTGLNGRNQWLPLAVYTPEAERVLSHPVDVHAAEPSSYGRWQHRAAFPSAVLTGLGVVPGRDIMLQTLDGGIVMADTSEATLGTPVALVPSELLERFGGPTRDGLILARLQHPERAADVIEALRRTLLPDNPGLDVGGGAEEKANLRAMLDGVTLVVTALLAVAALVALVGVGNTLALSVLERQRESALLRALGLPRAGLRRMLLVEAVAISVVAVLAGVAAGTLFGWALAVAATRQLGMAPPTLEIDWLLTLGTCLVIIATGALASVLPGRRAALAAPVEALADLG